MWYIFKVKIDVLCAQEWMPIHSFILSGDEKEWKEKLDKLNT